MADGAYTIEEDPNDKRNFFMTPVAGVEVPEDQQALQIEIQKILNALDLVYPRKQTELEGSFMAARNELLGWAKVGLATKPAQAALATRALPILKEDILRREAGRVKNAYMRRLGGRAVLMALPAILTCLIAVNFQNNAKVYREGREREVAAFTERAGKFRVFRDFRGIC